MMSIAPGRVSKDILDRGFALFRMRKVAPFIAPHEYLVQIKGGCFWAGTAKSAEGAGFCTCGEFLQNHVCAHVVAAWYYEHYQEMRKKSNGGVK